MKARVITVVIGVPLLLICCYVGGWLLALACGLLAALAAYELSGLFTRRAWVAAPLLDVLATLLLALSFGLIRLVAWPFALTALLVMLAYALWAQRREKPLSQSLLQALATFYVGVGFGSLLALRWGHNDWSLLLLAFLNVWITDSAAHLYGSRYGRAKLAPFISPNKTWAGAWAGLICAGLICSVYISLVLQVRFFTALPLALLFSVLAQVGDLLESALKRWAGVKDAGYIFPGHGGALDRFDSILFSTPFVLLLLATV